MRLTLLAAVLAAAVAVRPAAQVFHESSELVVLHVVVTDGKGRDVNALPASAFTLLQDGVPQTIRFFADEDSPVTIGLVIDSSISMWGIRDEVLAAADTFVLAARPEDQLFALAFNEQVWPALRPTEPFTSDAAVLRRALAVAMAPRGKTALFDAVSIGLDYASRGSCPRQILVVVSDGGDNASGMAFDDLSRKAESTNVVIYTVALADPNGGGRRDWQPLQRLAETTGGRMFTPSRTRDIDGALQAVGRDVRHAYTIAYAPEGNDDGAFHRLTVSVRSADGKALSAKTRTGYRARGTGATGQSSRTP